MECRENEVFGMQMGRIMERCAVFSCMGLGDGLIAQVLSNNLHLNGYKTVLFHPFLQKLQGWFPELAIEPFPGKEQLISCLSSFDRFFIMYEKSVWMQEILAYCQKHYPEKTSVLNPIATARRDYPYWEVGKFDGNRPFVDNLYQFCQNELGFKVVTKSNGIRPPEGVQMRRYSQRIVVHPESSREGKNWPKDKYVALAAHLESAGYEVLFALTEKERVGWEDVTAPECRTFDALAKMVCESGFMIGNDSGIGHLASCLGVPTLTICRSAQAAKFWRPSWSPAEVITPSPFIPNLKGLRLRDQHWKKWISVKKVLNRFEKSCCRN